MTTDCQSVTNVIKKSCFVNLTNHLTKFIQKKHEIRRDDTKL